MLAVHTYIYVFPYLQTYMCMGKHIPMGFRVYCKKRFFVCAPFKQLFLEARLRCVQDKRAGSSWSTHCRISEAAHVCVYVCMTRCRAYLSAGFLKLRMSVCVCVYGKLLGLSQCRKPSIMLCVYTHVCISKKKNGNGRDNTELDCLDLLYVCVCVFAETYFSLCFMYARMYRCVYRCPADVGSQCICMSVCMCR